MKKIYIIHGWSGSPDEPLHKWLASELKSKGFEVEVPAMPNPDEPVIKDWVAKLNQVVGEEPDEGIIFIGHSIGCQTILRYLAGLKTSGFFGGAVFIAPWLYVSGLETEEEKSIAKPWVETPIDNVKVWKYLPENKRIAIFSDNDPFVPKENWDLFEQKFGAKIIIEKEKGHFTADDGVNSLPSALKAVLDIAD